MDNNRALPALRDLLAAAAPPPFSRPSINCCSGSHGGGGGAVGSGKKAVMVVGVDESEHSGYALEWTLRHFFAPGQPQRHRLLVVAAKTPASFVVGAGAGAGTPELLPKLEADLKRAAAQAVDKAKRLCSQVVEDVGYEVFEGDARNVLCDAVERHHAEMLVVGSHGYGAFKRAVLGSVSDYCSHHAHCTVMIVKAPKHNKGEHV
ncbi:hypothetical protein ACP4OV_023268 [Aristida adscensionis]